MKAGLKHGPGTFIWKDKSVYNGSFENNKATGFGELQHIDGDVYLGEWKDDKANG